MKTLGKVYLGGAVTMMICKTTAYLIIRWGKKHDFTNCLAGVKQTNAEELLEDGLFAKTKWGLSACVDSLLWPITGFLISKSMFSNKKE